MPKLDMILHDVRESFRQYHWDKWAKSSRRDAAGDSYHGDIFRWVSSEEQGVPPERLFPDFDWCVCEPCGLAKNAPSGCDRLSIL